MSVKIWMKRKIKRVIRFKSKKAVVLLSSFLVCILFLGIYHFLLLPKIDLKGKKTMVVDYKGKYSEKGAVG